MLIKRKVLKGLKVSTEHRLLPKYSLETNKFSKEQKIKATLISLEKNKSPIMTTFLTSNPYAERKCGLGAVLKGKKRKWISAQSADPRQIVKSFGKNGFGHMSRQILYETIKEAKRSGLDLIMAWPHTSFVRKIEKEAGFENLTGTPIWLIKLR